MCIGTYWVIWCTVQYRMAKVTLHSHVQCIMRYEFVCTVANVLLSESLHAVTSVCLSSARVEPFSQSGHMQGCFIIGNARYPVDIQTQSGIETA
jgi:hypothetical protein